MSLECHSYVMTFVCHSYVLVCHPYGSLTYSYVIRKSLVCTCVSSVCHSYVLVCHPYVTRMYLFVICMSLVCGFTMNLVENANSIYTETLKTSSITGDFSNFIRFLLSERKQI